MWIDHACLRDVDEKEARGRCGDDHADVKRTHSVLWRLLLLRTDALPHHD